MAKVQRGRRWFLILQEFTIVQTRNAPGRALVLVMQQQPGDRFGDPLTPRRAPWSVVALDVPADKFKPADIFADHAHAVVCEDVATRELALAASERYAKAWRKGDKLPPCLCGNIATDGPTNGQRSERPGENAPIARARASRRRNGSVAA